MSSRILSRKKKLVLLHGKRPVLRDVTGPYRYRDRRTYYQTNRERILFRLRQRRAAQRGIILVEAVWKL